MQCRQQRLVHLKQQKKIVGDETPTKLKNIRVIDADTNIELYYRIEYHFTSNIIAYWLERCYDMSADIHTNDTPPVQSPMPAPPEKSSQPQSRTLIDKSAISFQHSRMRKFIKKFTREQRQPDEKSWKKSSSWHAPAIR